MDDAAARQMRVRLNTVSEALRPTMPMVADMLDEASDMIEQLQLEICRAYEADR